MSELKNSDVMAAALTGAVLFGITFAWFAFDHHVPMMDEAGHILRGLAYEALLSSPRPLDIAWWKELFTVSQFYPPMVYGVTGIIKALTFSSRWIDVVVQCCFTLILSCSMVMIGRLLGLGLRASVLAAVVINLFPGVSASNHQFMLDFPALAAVGAGLLAMLTWRNHPNARSSVAVGATLGICVLVKQIVAVFLIGVGVLLVIEVILGGGSQHRRPRLFQILTIVVCAVFVAGPWIAANQSFNRALIAYMGTDLSTAGMGFTFVDNLEFYLGSLYSSMSPFLLATFLISAFAMGLMPHRQLLPVTISALAGVALMSLYILPQERYVLSALIFPAFCIGAGLDRLLDAAPAPLRMSGMLIAVVACLQFVSFSFAPYPLHAWEPLSGLSGLLGVENKTDHGKGGHKDNPVQQADWGHVWALDVVEKRDGDTPVYLNVMANHPQVNAQTFDLFAREHEGAVQATTSRVWTITGDTVDFNEQSALYHHWYLFKSGDNGFRLRDQESVQNHDRLFRFVKGGTRYERVASHRIHDGSVLTLFRQVPARQP